MLVSRFRHKRKHSAICFDPDFQRLGKQEFGKKLSFMLLERWFYTSERNLVSDRYVYFGRALPSRDRVGHINFSA